MRMDDDVVERPALACALQLDPIDHHARQTTRLTARQRREQVGRADLCLEMRARRSARCGTDCSWLCRTFLTQQPAPSDRLFPSRVAPSSDAPHNTFGTKFSERSRDRRTTNGWERPLQVGVSKLVW